MKRRYIKPETHSIALIPEDVMMGLSRTEIGSGSDETEEYFSNRNTHGNGIWTNGD